MTKIKKASKTALKTAPRINLDSLITTLMAGQSFHEAIRNLPVNKREALSLFTYDDLFGINLDEVFSYVGPYDLSQFFFALLTSASIGRMVHRTRVHARDITDTLDDLGLGQAGFYLAREISDTKTGFVDVSRSRGEKEELVTMIAHSPSLNQLYKSMNMTRHLARVRLDKFELLDTLYECLGGSLRPEECWGHNTQKEEETLSFEYSNEILIQALRESNSITEAAVKVGCSRNLFRSRFEAVGKSAHDYLGLDTEAPVRRQRSLSAVISPEDLVSLLQNSRSLEEAEEKLGYQRSSIAKLLKKNLLESPKFYLGQSLPKEPELQFPEAGEPGLYYELNNKTQYSDSQGVGEFLGTLGELDISTQTYEDLDDHEEFMEMVEDILTIKDIPEEVRRDICVCYTNNGGLGLSKKAICMALAEDFDLTVEMVKAVLDSEGQTKAAPAQTSGQFEDRPEETLEENRGRRDRLLQRAKSTKNMAAELADLRVKYEDARSFYKNIASKLHRDTVEYFSSAQYAEDFSNKKCVRIIPVSDLHVGSVNNIGESESRHAKPFNVDILHQKVDMICHRIAAEATSNEEAVMLLGLGDLFEAIFGNMRPGQMMSMDVMGAEQWRVVKGLIRRLADEILSVYPEHVKLFIGLQGGNHDRAMADKSFGSQHVIMQILSDNFIDIYENNSRVSVKYLDPFHRMEVNGCGLLLFHGDSIKVKTHTDVAKILMNRRVENVRKHILIQGHIHRYGVLSGAAFRFISLPAITESTDFERGQLNKVTDSEFIMIDLFDDHEQILGPYPL